MAKLSILCISDTHLRNGFETKPVDVILHAGDHTMVGRVGEMAQAAMQLQKRAAKLRITTPGNHDWLSQKDPATARNLFEEKGIIYLLDEAYTISPEQFPQLDRPLKVWGSPWQPRFYDWAFNLDRGAPIKEKWDLIPEDTDILITHGPPAGILDRAPRGFPEEDWSESDFEFHSEHVGCEDLLEAVNRVRPGLHVFGHIHADKGWRRSKGRSTLFVNAAVCNERYDDSHKPIVVEYENGSFEIS